MRDSKEVMFGPKTIDFHCENRIYENETIKGALSLTTIPVEKYLEKAFHLSSTNY